MHKQVALSFWGKTFNNMNSSGDSILLISPTYRTWWVAPFPGLGWIASSLERIGVESKIIDCQITRDYKKRIFEYLKYYNTIGITANIGTISSALEIASFIREFSPKTRIIFGGPHPTAIYDKLIPKYADIVVLGEGEDTIVELVRQTDLSQIKGIAYWDGSIKANPKKNFIENLDRLGFPAWHLYDLKKYKFSFGYLPLAIVTSSRGCPNHCIYCSEDIHGYKIRLRSLENVFTEIDYLVNISGTREISISDDNFTFYPERVKQFCKTVIERKYRRPIYFSAPYGIRSDIGDLEMFKLMEQAGFYRITMGVDSGSPEVLNKIKRVQNLEKINKTLSLINKTKIKVKLNFIIGLPSDTLETMKQTIDFARSLLVRNPCVFWEHFTTGIPLPGTEFFRMVEEKGKFLCDLTLSSSDFYGKAVYELGNLKASDVTKMFTKANIYIFLMPTFIWRALRVTFKLREIPVLMKYLWLKVFRNFFKCNF